MVWGTQGSMRVTKIQPEAFLGVVLQKINTESSLSLSRNTQRTRNTRPPPPPPPPPEKSDFALGQSPEAVALMKTGP